MAEVVERLERAASSKDDGGYVITLDVREVRYLLTRLRGQAEAVARLDRRDAELINLVLSERGISCDDVRVLAYSDDRGRDADTINRCAATGVIRQIGDRDTDNYSLVHGWWPHQGPPFSTAVSDPGKVVAWRICYSNGATNFYTHDAETAKHYELFAGSIVIPLYASPLPSPPDRNAIIEECAKAVQGEPELDGDMPDELHRLPLEDVLLATVRATKRRIAASIRSLKSQPVRDEDLRPDDPSLQVGDFVSINGDGTVGRAQKGEGSL